MPYPESKHDLKNFLIGIMFPRNMIVKIITITVIFDHTVYAEQSLNFRITLLNFLTVCQYGFSCQQRIKMISQKDKIFQSVQIVRIKKHLDNLCKPIKSL